jgi:hypothetical protein
MLILFHLQSETWSSMSSNLALCVALMAQSPLETFCTNISAT